MGGTTRRSRTITGEELLLWLKVAEDAKPLARRRRAARADGAPPSAAAAEVAPTKGETASPAPAPPAAPGTATAKGSRKPPPPPLAPGVSAGVDRRTDGRLRRGRLTIEARLDLHGLTQAEAHHALAAFIDQGVGQGRRCVLVITGKGAPGRGGVLRTAMPRWLNEPNLRDKVVALHPARPQDGGEGAFYLLLRRRREPR